MKICLRLFLASLLLTGVIYPLFITAFAHLIFPHISRGSLVEVNGKIVGSTLIAQKFTNDGYFWPRPSAKNYNPMDSGGSNLGPTSKKLFEEVEKRDKNGKDLHKEMLFSSASGLDPDISVENAFSQAKRVAKARNLTLEIIKGLIFSKVKPSSFGASYVNVLELNVALDKL